MCGLGHCKRLLLPSLPDPGIFLLGQSGVSKMQIQVWLLSLNDFPITQVHTHNTPAWPNPYNTLQSARCPALSSEDSVSWGLRDTNPATQNYPWPLTLGGTHSSLSWKPKFMNAETMTPTGFFLPVTCYISFESSVSAREQPFFLLLSFHPVLTVASWPAYKFLKRQIRWSGIPISFRIFHSLLWSTQWKALA